MSSKTKSFPKITPLTPKVVLKNKFDSHKQSKNTIVPNNLVSSTKRDDY